MTLLVLVILAAVWAIYLVSWARSRTEHRRVNSINSFSRHLSTLERTAPGTRRYGGERGSLSASVTSLSVSSVSGQAYFAPHRPSLSQTKKRRRDILLGLLAATGVTLLATLAMGGLATYTFVVALVLTVAYVVALANLQKQALERRAKVHYLSDATAPALAVAPDVWAEDGYVEENDDVEDASGYSYPLHQVYAVNGR